MAKQFNPADNLPPPKPKSPPGTTKSTRNNGEPWTKENLKELLIYSGEIKAAELCKGEYAKACTDAGIS